MPRRKILLLQKIASLILSIIVLAALLYVVAYYQRGLVFEDANLEAAIRDKLDNHNGPISKTDLLQITHLDASGYDIKRLEGIEKLTRLVVLDLEDNQIKDLNPLQNLSRLSELSLRNNGVTDLGDINFDAITNLPLRSLNLCHNVVRFDEGGQIRLSDISLLSELMTLEELELRDNHIEVISPLNSLTNLLVLDLRENRIEDISALESLTELTELNLRENEIRDISALADLTDLTYLNLHSNDHIQTVTPLANLINLETLILRNVPVGDEINVLKRMTSLMNLNLRNSGVTDVTVLRDLILKGALQDDLETGVTASINLRDNILRPYDLDAFLIVRDKWINISYREPFEFPKSVSNLKPPFFSHTGGFYEEPFELHLTSDNPEIKIYYTLDGSIPCPDNTEGTVYYYKNDYPTEPGDPFGKLLSRSYRTHQYKAPITISKDGYRDDEQGCISTVNTTRFSGAFEPPGDVFRGTVVRAVAHKEGYLPSEVVTHSYFVGQDIMELYNIPVISLVTDEPNLFDYYIGLHVAGEKFDEWRGENPDEKAHWNSAGNYRQRGHQWERQANIELFNLVNNLQLNQLIGLRNHGNFSRLFPKKSFRIYAREQYGNNSIEADLFDKNSPSIFKRLILRNSGNDRASTLFRDAMMHGLVKTLQINRQNSQLSVVFVNGVYWGVYNIRDRYDRYYLKYKYDLDPYNIDLLQNNARVREGGNDHYNAMLQFIENNDVNESAVYDRINELMVVESFIDLNIAQIFYRNTDWPHNNIDFWRLRTEQFKPDAPYGHDGRWRWMLNDTDHGFGLSGGENAYTHNTMQHASREEEWSTYLLRSLLENDSFRHQFINRYADHLNTIFYPTFVVEQIDMMENLYAPLMQDQIDRWGQPGSIENWEENVDVLRDFALKRPDYCRQHIIKQFGLNGVANFNLYSAASEGFIRINSIDVNYGTAGVTDPHSWTGIYFMDVPISISAIPNPGYHFVGWEGIDSLEQELTLVLDGDITLTAIFEKED